MKNNLIKIIGLIIVIVLLSIGIYYFYTHQKSNVSSVCEIQNCHGLEISCGPSPVQMCTEEYQLGDICRKFASCEIKNNQCAQKEDDNFNLCKTCVENCQTKTNNNPEEYFRCEAKCDPTVIVSPSPNQTYAFPIENYFQNQTKKVFGKYITKENSPVSPERFSGYHAGVDIEINPEQLDKEVPVYAITDSELIYKKWVSGYGGVAILKFQLNGENMTALYGHLNIDSISKNVGEKIQKGEKLGILGKAYSTETDGERKHLHFSIHKGDSTELKGYVSNQSELSSWVDPNSLFK